MLLAGHMVIILKSDTMETVESELARINKEITEMKNSIYGQHKQLRRLKCLDVAMQITNSRFIPEKVLETADVLEAWVRGSDRVV